MRKHVASNLAGALRDRYLLHRAISDLDEGIMLQREAFNISAPSLAEAAAIPWARHAERMRADVSNSYQGTSTTEGLHEASSPHKGTATTQSNGGLKGRPCEMTTEQGYFVVPDQQANQATVRLVPSSARLEACQLSVAGVEKDSEAPKRKPT